MNRLFFNVTLIVLRALVPRHLFNFLDEVNGFDGLAYLTKL